MIISSKIWSRKIKPHVNFKACFKGKENKIVQENYISTFKGIKVEIICSEGVTLIFPGTVFWIFMNCTA
jgi:hypothetical protein